MCESVETTVFRRVGISLSGTEGRMYSYGQHRNRDTCNTPIEGPGPQGRNVPYTSGEKEDCKTPRCL